MEIEREIIKWAEDRELLSKEPESIKSQTMKLVSEVGELCDSLASYDGILSDDTIDALGDVEVVMAILYHKLSLNRKSCLEYAYNQIKNRTGKTINGVFIKDEK